MAARRKRRNQRDPRIRLAIIGAGPAGLYCAAALARNDQWKGEITVLEKGPPAALRLLSKDEWLFKPGKVLEGEGGPGFLADAKLCVSSDAGAQFNRVIQDLYPKAVSDIDFEIFAALLEKGHEVRLFQANPHAVAAAKKRLAAIDVTLETYPVRALGSDLAHVFLALFVEELRSRLVDIRCETQATSITYSQKEDLPFQISVSGPSGIDTVHASHLVLAVGRSGATWLAKQNLGLQTEPNHLDIGVRIEFPHWGGEQIRELGANPKFKCKVGKSYAKTHCFVHAGRVIAYILDGRCLVDAHAVASRTNASSMNILFRVSDAHMYNPKSVYGAISEVAESIGQGKPLRMSLPSFLGSDSLPDDGTEFTPTLLEAKETDLGLVYPETVLTALRTLITRLSKFAPGIATKGSMVYGPAAEWLSSKVKIDAYFRVAGLRNAWCIGDCSGLTSGVLPAAASGVMAALDILKGPSEQRELEWEYAHADA